MMNVLPAINATIEQELGIRTEKVEFEEQMRKWAAAPYDPPPLYYRIGKILYGLGWDMGRRKNNLYFVALANYEHWDNDLKRAALAICNGPLRRMNLEYYAKKRKPKPPKTHCVIDLIEPDSIDRILETIGKWVKWQS